MRKYTDMILLHSGRMADHFGGKFAGLSRLDRAVALTLADVFAIDLIRVQHDLVCTTIKVLKARQKVAKVAEADKSLQSAADKAREAISSGPVKILTQPEMKLLPITPRSEESQSELGDANTFGYTIR